MHTHINEQIAKNTVKINQQQQN